MNVVFVQERNVVVDVLLIREHAAKAVLYDDRDFVAVRRIVAAAVRDEGREDLAMPVFVLQSLTVERRASAGTAEKKSARARVTGGPCQIADALKAEHRIEDVERDHRQIVIRVRGARGDER